MKRALRIAILMVGLVGTFIAAAVQQVPAADGGPLIDADGTVHLLESVVACEALGVLEGDPVELVDLQEAVQHFVDGLRVGDDQQALRLPDIPPDPSDPHAVRRGALDSRPAVPARRQAARHVPRCRKQRDRRHDHAPRERRHLQQRERVRQCGTCP